MTSEELDAKIAEMLADPEVRAELERRRAECPHMTVEQIAAGKAYADELFGL